MYQSKKIVSKELIRVIFLCLIILLIAIFVRAQPSINKIAKLDNGTFEIIRNGMPYLVQGAGADNPKLYRELALRGGNSVRTWGVGVNTRALLDSAHANGLTVLIGLWVNHEHAGFDYNNATRIANQLEGFRGWVQKLKDHPAILGWGIGNEVNLNYKNLNVWNAINDISKMIHEETGGNHLTCTVLAGTGVTLINHVAERCPDLDFLGINLYDGLQAAASTVKASNWKKPYMLTEWGVNGNWGTQKTPYGAPMELNSGEKYSLIDNRYTDHINANKGHLIGNYVFFWNFKNEGSLTWFGLWVHDHTTEMVDALQKHWSGKLPSNRAPRMQLMTINGKPQSSNLTIEKPNENTVEVFAFDHEDDPLTFEYIIQPWPKEIRDGLQDVGLSFSTIPSIISVDGKKAKLSFKPEHNGGKFRLYAFVRDNRKHVATASFVFKVEFKEQLKSNELPIIEDVFVRDGAFENTNLGVTDQYKIEVKKSGTQGFSRLGLLKVDLSKVPSDVNELKLKLYGKSPVQMNIKLGYSEDISWLEDSLTFNKFNINPINLNLETAIGTEQKWYEWNLSQLLKIPSIRNKVITLVLEGASSYIGDPASFSTKEVGVDVPRLQFENLTSIDVENLNSKIEIVPNPVQEFIHLKSVNFEWKNFKIYDYSGRLQLSGELYKSISVKDLKSGKYLLIVYSNDETSSSKSFVKL